jgi:4-amino-4-deoxy-L-arabinose transferase-like glycosyltransferase
VLGWYLLTQTGLVFAVFTVVRTKLPHYTLPAFPLLSLWLALRILSERDPGKWVERRATAMITLALILTLGVFAKIQPYLVAANLWRQVRPFSQSNMEFATVDFNEPSLVWEFRRGLTNYLQQITLEQAGPFLQREGPRILILPTRQFTGGLQNLATNMVSLRAAGIDTARFRRIDLTAVVKSGSN